MAIQQVFVETVIEHEDDYIIFGVASGDAWKEGTFCYSVTMYKPMYLANGHMIMHPYAYENGRATKFFERKGFGFSSLADAMERVDHAINSITYLIETLGIKVDDVQEKCR